MARVSVIIATYNRAHCLEKAIESVLQQTFRDFDLIIADDGSTDDTAAVVDKYLRPSHPLHGRIQYVHQHNQGKSVALNNALARTSSEWIAFLDSDDEWLPGKLDQQFQILQRFPEAIACFTDFTYTNNPSMKTTGFLYYGRDFHRSAGMLPGTARVLLDAPFVSVVTLVCRAKLIREVGGFDPYLRFTEDYDFVFRLSLQGDFCFVNVPLVMVDRSVPAERHTGKSAVWDDVAFRLNCEQYRYEKWLGLVDGLSSEMRKIISRKLRAVHSGWANEHLQHGEYDRAMNSIAEAVKYQATPNLAAKWLLTRICPSMMRDLAVRRGGFKTEHF